MKSVFLTIREMLETVKFLQWVRDMKAGNTGHRGNWDSTSRHACSQAGSQVVL